MIEFKQLSKTYVVGDSEVKALDRIDLKIASGEFAGIIGPSGSGKSTMMHIMGCLDKPTAGEYLLEERPVESYSDNELADTRNKRIGFVFQSFNLLPKMTIFDNVELPLIYQGIKPAQRKARVTAALEQVDLLSRAGHTPNSISGGQQQRAAIARAIVTDPAIILADEPTGNLDQETGHEIMQVFRDLNANGRTVILITHDNEVAAQAHRCIRLIDGRIVEDTQADRRGDAINAVIADLTGGSQ
jgi:putative ABC transport system ATP-binding protein